MKLFLVLSTLLVTGILSHASITTVGGSGNILSAGPGVGYTADFFGDASLIIHGWDEKQNVTLASNLAVDISTLGTFTSLASMTPGIIPAGTVVSSHAFYYDPLAGGSVVAGFQFDGPVIGVILNDGAVPDPFIASDFLIPGTIPSGNIPTSHFDARGLEVGINTDHLTVGANFVQLFLSAGSPGDQLRVLTAVPEPGTAGLLLLSGAILLLKPRRAPFARRRADPETGR